MARIIGQNSITHYMGSYDDYLKSIKEELLSYKPEMDVWNNFRRFLGG